MKRKSPEYKYKFVLLIDDNDLDNFINEKMVELNHFSRKTRICTNGLMALDFVTSLVDAPGQDTTPCPDLMFVDLNMPVMNGFEFIENLKKINDERWNKCKIVILTSSIHSEDRVKAGKIDSAIIFVNKPLTNEILSRL